MNKLIKKYTYLHRFLEKKCIYNKFYMISAEN